jgi:hypothetical protein
MTRMACRRMPRPKPSTGGQCAIAVGTVDVARLCLGPLDHQQACGPHALADNSRHHRQHVLLAVVDFVSQDRLDPRSNNLGLSVRTSLPQHICELGVLNRQLAIWFHAWSRNSSFYESYRTQSKSLCER